MPTRPALALLPALAAALLLAGCPPEAVAPSTVRVSVGPPDVPAPSSDAAPALSADGRVIAYTARFGYESPARPGFRDVYVRTLDDGEPVLASVSSEGVQPDGDSYDAVLSAEGSVVAFVSEASNLVPDDANGVHDVFVRDLETGRTERVSVASDGAEANGPSYHRPTISADGRFVGFWSAATNLVADDTNARGDAFVHDRLTGLTTRESVGTGGVQASSDDPPSLSADGRFLAFSSGAATIRPPTQASGDYLYLRDRWNDLTTPVGRKDNGYPMRGEEPVLSADAAAVAFVSDSELNGSLLESYRDVFVADAVTGETVKASAALGGARTINGSGFPAISADGRFIAFSSLASNLVPDDSNGASDVFVFDRMTASLTRESVHDDGSQRADGGSSPALDGTGGVVAFYSFETRVELYLDQEVFIRNRATGTVQIAAPDARGVQGDAASGSCGVSADGRRVAFASRASNLVAGDQNRHSDVFVADLSKRTLRRASVSSQGAEADGDSQGQPSLSADGRFVAFQSKAGNLAPDDADPLFNVFVHDTVGGATVRASVSSDGVGGDSTSNNPEMSADGGVVAFRSDAGNLVPDDTNDLSDIFVHDLSTRITERASVSSAGEQAAPWPGLCHVASDRPAVSATGRFVAFASCSSNLAKYDFNDISDVFVRDRLLGTTERVSLAWNWEEAAPPGGSGSQRISADGRYVAFSSDSTNLVPGDQNGATDVFVRDRALGTTTRVSLGPDGVEGEYGSLLRGMSADGRFILFSSDSTTLVPDDHNGQLDAFVRDRVRGATFRVSLGDDGAEANSLVQPCGISADGRFVAFFSEASNLVPGDRNNVADIFLRDRGWPLP